MNVSLKNCTSQEDEQKYKNQKSLLETIKQKAKEMHYSNELLK